MIRGATLTAAPLDRRLALTLPLAIGGAQVVAGGVDLLLAAALDRIEPGVPVTTFGGIGGVAALLALILYPLSGLASDRTPPRLGRRSTWVVVGALGTAAGLLTMGNAGSTVGLALGFVVAVACLPVVIVPLYASIADRIGEGNRGTVGALVGAATIVGGMLGNVLAARLAGEPLLATVVFAAILLGGALAVAAFGGEERSAHVPVPPSLPVGSAPAGSARPRPDRDLAWFTIGRFALFLGYAIVVMLVFFVLRDHVRHPEPVRGVATFAVVTGLATLVASAVAGPLSDRWNRRKPFVAAAGLVLAAGLGLPAVAPGFEAFLVAAVLIGFGFGTYLSVGIAVGTLILPAAATAGRDIGLIGLANASAQVVAPFAGSYVAATFGYPVLFLAAAAASLVAALAVVRIRGVR